MANGYADWGPPAVQQRRWNVGQNAPQAWTSPQQRGALTPWDTPQQHGALTPRPAAAWSQPQGYGYATDPILRQQLDLMLANSAAAQRGARSAARTSYGYDPSMAAFADLSGMIGGQSDVAQGMGQASYGRSSQLDQRKWDEYMMREQAKLEEEMQRRANAGGIWGDIGSLAGTGIGAYFGGPLGAQFGSQLGGMAGGRR